MALSPEEAAALGLPVVASPGPRRLSDDEAAALGLPVAAAPRIGMGDVQLAQAGKDPGRAGAFLAHAANGLAVGQAPRLVGLHRAGSDEENEGPMDPLSTVVNAAKGAYRLLRGDPVAQSQYQTGERETREDLKQGAVHHPVLSIAGEGLGGALPATAIAGAVPAVQGAGLLPKLLTGARQGAAIGAAYGLGNEDPALGALRGGEGGAVAGAAAPAVTAAAGKLLSALRGPLSDAAESAAVRATNADRTAARRVFGRPMDEEARARTGRFLLDEGVPLRSPAAMKEGLEGILGEEGPQIGNLAKRAGAAGATFDLQNASQRVMSNPTIADLAADTEGRPTYDRIAAFFNDKLKNGDTLTPEEGHALRRRLDTLAKWDKTRPDDANAAWRAARDEVNQELGDTLARAGLGDEWAVSNARFAQGKKALDLASVGAERRAGNRLGSPSEKAAAIAGGVAGALHNPVAGVALPAATIALNRFAMPVAARTADALSRAAEAAPELVPSLSPAAVSAALEPDQGLARYLSDAMRRRAMVRIGLKAAAADQGRTEPGSP